MEHKKTQEKTLGRQVYFDTRNSMIGHGVVPPSVHSRLQIGRLLHSPIYVVTGALTWGPVKEACEAVLDNSPHEDR